MLLTSALLSANYGMSLPNIRVYELFTNIQSKDVSQGDQVVTPYFSQLSLKAVCREDEKNPLSLETVSHLGVSGTVVLTGISPIKPVHFTFDRSFRFDALISEINNHINGKHCVKLSSQELAAYHVKMFAVQIQAYIIRLMINLGFNEISESKAVASWLGSEIESKALLQPQAVGTGKDVAYISYEIGHFVYEQLLSQLVGMLSIEYTKHQTRKNISAA